MKKYIFILIFPLLLLGQSSVKRLKYIDHYDRPMTSYKEWSAKVVKEPFSLAKVYRTGYDSFRQELVDIVVYAPIYTGILDSLNMYIIDLEAEGYTVQVDTVRGWTAIDLRNHFASLLGNHLVGAVLIGNVPFAWYEMSGGDGREEFPIDLFLMDLDGNWVDSDGDGLYDDHTGSRAPEIWVGRIFASSMTWGNEIYLVNNYLSKIHKYRTGGYNIPQKALAYVDDDWYGFNDCDLDYLYDTVVVVRQYNTTTAADFRTRFNDPYEWVQICSHSSPWGNTFKYTGGYAGTVFNFEVWFANPPFLFANLFQCSGTRFFEENFCGGCYVFGPANGLLTIGSAKVGSMLHFDDFYGPLNTGISIGEAFKQWFTQWGITDQSWFYGMCIIGDPLLKPKQSGKQFARWKKNDPHFNTFLNWSDPEPVDLDSETDGYVATTTDGAGRIWAAWVTGRSVSNGRTEICVSYRQGGAWSSPEIVDPYLYWDFFPALTCDNLGRAALSWSRCYGRNYDIFLSTYDGSNWAAPFRVSSRATDALHPAMTLDAGPRLWVTMERWNHLNGDIYCRYHDGSSWQSMFAVTVGSANDYKPEMATDSTGKAWTVWTSERYQENRNIYVKDYNEASGHWENLRRITGNPNQDQDPKICVDGDGTVWVAWTTWRNGNSDIYESHYNGVTWSNPQAITTDDNQDEHCALAVDQDGYVWCIWQSDRTGDWEIVGKYYQDGEWQGLSNISNSTYMDILPDATLDDSGNVWMLFQTDRNGNWDIYASKIFSDLVSPQVTVVVPNGGEVWNIGDIDTIRWVATDNHNIDTVSIFYSTNSGSDWIEIAHGEPNDSIFEWQIPATPSNECLVRIVAFDEFPNSGEDVSDSLFSIVDGIPPDVSVIVPNGGEVWFWNEVHTIEWNSQDDLGIDSLNIHLSLDGGATYPMLIAHIDGNDSLYDWTIPETTSYECLVRITAYDIGGNAAFDESDSLFTIGIEGIEELLNVPKYFAVNFLSSNPFIDRLNLKLQIPNEMPVKIAVYNVEGRFVDDIVDTDLKPGYHMVSWRNKDIPSGVYFLYIKTDKIKETKKIIKLK